MVFEEKEIKKPFVLLLVAIIIQVTFVDATNFDCKGKAFYCLNSTHFMICVDLGDGISRTVGDFLIPCPPPTICTENNNFECEYYTTTTPESIISPSEEMKPITKSALRTFWGDSDSTTPIPFGYKSDDSIKSEKYFNTVSKTTTENNILDKVHSTASFIKLTPEETTQHSEEAFTSDIPIDIKNGTETELHMQDRINEMLNANIFTTVFIPLTKKVSENVNNYESTIVRESTNTELTPFTVTGAEGYDSHSTTPSSELYFDTISITTLSGSTEKPIFLNHETSSRNSIQENNISMNWNWKDKSEQSSTAKYYDTSNILDIFDASTTEKKYEINTYSTRNTIPTTAEVDISLNDLHTTTTNLEFQLPFQNLEILTNQDEGNTQSLISDINLKILQTTQSTDKTWHGTFTNIYQLEDTTKSYGIKKKVRTNIFKNQKKDKETKLHLDISTTDSERLDWDFSTRASDTMPPDIYLKTTVLEATERSNSEITTQLQDFLNKKRLFSTIKGDGTSNSHDVKDELTTDLVGNGINIMGVKVIKQPQPNFQIKNRGVLDTDEMFTKDYYTFEKGDTESTIENDVTTSSQNLLFSVESTTSSYVSDDEVSNNISEVLNNKTKDKIAFNSVENMRENNVEIFPLLITTEAEENMTYKISGNKNNIFPIKLLNTHNKSTVNPTVYEKTSAVTENIINILTFSNVDLLENKVTSKDPLLISTRFDLNLNADTVTDNFKHDIEYEETTNSNEKMISNVTNDSLLSRSFKNIKETKTNNANILNVTHEESVIDLPVQMGLNNYEVITTEFGILPTQINIDDSYLNLPKESELLNETRENNLLITEQKPSKTISEYNLRSDIDEKYYFSDQFSITDINLNKDLNVPTVEPVMFTSKGQTLKGPFENKSTLFFFTTEINSFDKEKQFDATTTATLLRDSYMLTTPENAAKLETIQENFNEKITKTRNEDTRVLPDMLGTDVTFTEQVFMVPDTSKRVNIIINNKITSDKPAYDTLFQNNTVTDGYYKNEKRDSKTSLDILLKIDNVTKLTNNYSSYNFTPNYIVKDKQDIFVTDFDSQIIKSDSKSLRKYPSTLENTDSSTSLYSAAKIGFAPMLKLSTVIKHDKTKQINEFNTLKDELISIRPTMNNSQDTTVVYNKEDKEEARESNKMIQDFDYKIDISQVTVSYNGFSTPLNVFKEITTPDKPKLFVKHTINTDEYSTTPYQIKENNSDFKQNKNISYKGQPPTSDVNLTLTDNNLFISPQSKSPQVKLLTLISNEKAVNSDIILSNNQNKNKEMRPSYDIIGYVLNRNTEIPPMIPVYETPNSDVETDKTSKIIIPEIEENNSKIKTNVSLIHLELHRNHSLLSSTSKLVDKFNTTGMHNGSTVNPGSIREEDTVTEKTLSDNNNNIQKQHETNATQSENSNMFSHKKIETNPYVTVPPVNLKAINFNCLNRRSGKYSDHNNCQRFYICIGRLLPIVGQCPINTVFSEILKQCTHNFSHCIRRNQFQCITSGRFSDMWARDTYYICVKSNKKYIRFKLKCQKGYYLNRTSITCMEDNVSLNLSLSKDSYSTVSSSGSADSRSVQISSKGTKNEFKCVKQGIFPDPNDCKKYYICEKQSKSEFRRKKKKCDSDEVFHKRKRKCVDEESYECTT